MAVDSRISAPASHRHFTLRWSLRVKTRSDPVSGDAERAQSDDPVKFKDVDLDFREPTAAGNQTENNQIE